MRETALLQSALRKTTEGLARALAHPSGATPEWSALEWTVARAVAAMHGVSPLLSRRLAWRGPVDWTEFLARQYAHTATRHVRIQALLRSIDARVVDAGIPAMALKGVALHALGLYAPGERPMADIDLLVRPVDAPRMRELLAALGYRAGVACWKEQVFTPMETVTVDELGSRYGEHGDNPIKIELHQRICEKLPLHITDVTDRVFPAAGHVGLNAYGSRGTLMLHLLLHAAGATAFQSLRLLHLHDIASLAAQMTGADWDELVQPGGVDAQWWRWPPLRLTSLYYPDAFPGDVLAAARRDCPRRLVRTFQRKTLSDVSYSHLGIDAFPGVEWTRTVSERLHYMASRVRPSVEHLELRETVSKTEAWAAGAAWPALSHGRRMAAWLVSRPPRTVTMHSLRAAMAELP
jgi:Uncharacterised nucleotidyltransferase